MSKGNSGLFKTEQINFYVGPNGKALHAKYKKWIGVNRRERLLKKLRIKKLKNAIDQLYRPGSFIGDGGTASALKFERETGIGINNGKTHEQKAREYHKYICRIINECNLSPSDRKLADNLNKSLIKSIGDKK